MATKRTASSVDSLTDQDKVTRRVNHVLQSSLSPALADNDIWDLGPISTARGSDGVYLIRYGTEFLIATLSGTTLTFTATTTLISATTDAKIQIVVTGSRLTFVNRVDAGLAAGAIVVHRLA